MGNGGAGEARCRQSRLRSPNGFGFGAERDAPGRRRQRASSSSSAYVFRAVLADGSRVKGMVFPGELVWDDDPPPQANAGLVGKGR